VKKIVIPGLLVLVLCAGQMYGAQAWWQKEGGQEAEEQEEGAQWGWQGPLDEEEVQYFESSLSGKALKEEAETTGQEYQKLGGSLIKKVQAIMRAAELLSGFPDWIRARLYPQGRELSEEDAEQLKQMEAAMKELGGMEAVVLSDLPNEMASVRRAATRDFELAGKLIEAERKSNQEFRKMKKAQTQKSAAKKE
jgi:hypothetical protein